MTEEKYQRRRKANQDRDLFACGKQPHDRLWEKYDQAYALTPWPPPFDKPDYAGAILEKWRGELLRSLVQMF